MKKKKKKKEKCPYCDGIVPKNGCGSMWCPNDSSN